MRDPNVIDIARCQTAAAGMVKAMAGLSLAESLYAVTLTTSVILRTSMPDQAAPHEVVEGLRRDLDEQVTSIFGRDTP